MKDRLRFRTAGAALGIILLVAAGLRVWYLLHVTATPGFVWDDPDLYIAHGQTLVHNGHWRWTFDAVSYSIAGRTHALPPLYAVFLSWFVPFPNFPLTVRIAQVLLSVGAVALTAALGRLVHSTGAGLLAAAAFAIWVPNILNVWSTSQETVYIPLVLLAFVALAWAMAGDRRAWVFGVAGLAFGVAALARSMPMFFMLPAAVTHVAIAPARRRAAAQAAAMLIGFGVVTIPYSVALSQHFGQFTFIDSHGSIHGSAQGDASSGRAPGFGESIGALWQEVSAQPLEYLSSTGARARTLFYVNGGRLLQIYVVAGSRLSAMVWKWLIDLGSDIPLLISVALAGVGVAVCRVPRAAIILVVWAIVNVAVASVGGFGGARLRAPFEPILLVLAGAALTARWWSAAKGWLALGVLTGVMMTAVVLPQFERSLRGRPDYGIDWPSVLARRTGTIASKAGVNVLVGVHSVAAFTLTSERTAHVRILINGVVVQSITVVPGDNRRVNCYAPGLPIAFVELETTEPLHLAIAP